MFPKFGRPTCWQGSPRQHLKPFKHYHILILHEYPCSYCIPCILNVTNRFVVDPEKSRYFSKMEIQSLTQHKK